MINALLHVFPVFLISIVLHVCLECILWKVHVLPTALLIPSCTLLTLSRLHVLHLVYRLILASFKLASANWAVLRLITAMQTHPHA